MKRSLLPSLVMVGWIWSVVAWAGGHELGAPVTLNSLVVETIDGGAGSARIRFSGRLNVAGEVDLGLHLPDNGEGAALLVARTWDKPKAGRRGDTIVASWDVTLPRDGYVRLADLRCSVAIADEGGRATFGTSALFCLYADIAGGAVRSFGPLPDPRHVHKSPSMPLEKQGHRNDRAIASGVPVTIDIHISGRIACGAFNQSSTFLKGVPAVMVYIDWDADNNYATYQHPAYADGAVEWAVTDAEGYYQFNRQVIAEPDDPVWDIHQIRMTAQAANPGGQDEELGQEAVFTNSIPQQIAISPSSPDISLTLDLLDVDFRYGNTLRYMMRARAFCFQTFGRLPDPLDFEVDQPISKFWHDPTGFASPTLEVGVRTIEQALGAFDIYHEYGHYVHYLYGDHSPMSECDGPHSWNVPNTDECAFAEGWADFFAAAAFKYYYEREMPERREDDRYGNSTEAGFQFPDAGQWLLPNNDGDVEGAASCFLYDLWDDIHPRAPGFTGDNEDLGYPFGYDASMFIDAMNDVSLYDFSLWNLWTRRKPTISVYRDNFIGLVNGRYPITSQYHHESIDALFDAMTGRAASQTVDIAPHRSPTPTTLTITTTSPQLYRTLQWNSPGEPSVLHYIPESRGIGLLDLVQNHPDGFVIWRKQVTQPGAWDGRDGRLDHGYQRIAVVGSNPRIFTDAASLGPGTYSYVVVAYNNRDPLDPLAMSLSIPKAEARIVVPRKTTIRDDGQTPCTPVRVIERGTSAQLIAAMSDSSAATYRWIAANMPPFITMFGTTTSTLTIVNGYLPGGGSYPLFPPFSIRCISVDGSGTADTSLPYYPAFDPLDSAAAMVLIPGSGGLVRDGDPLRGLEFVTRPLEDVTSARPLTLAPSHDSLGYHLVLTGFPAGTIRYDDAKLFAVDHPSATELLEAPDCGYSVFKHAGDSLVEDHEHWYGLVELPLKGAARQGGGSVIDALREHDSLHTSLSAGDSLVLLFDDPAYHGDTAHADSAAGLADIAGRAGWTRSYLLRLSGEYMPGEVESKPGAEWAPPTLPGASIQLGQNVPNPCSGMTSLSYHLGAEMHVTLLLYGMDGRVVRTLVDESQGKGGHTIELDVKDLAAGNYCYQLVAGGRGMTRLLTVVR